MITRPEVNEYATYAKPYIDLIPNNTDITTYLTDHLETYKTVISGYPPQTLITSHEAGEWTIQEVLMHVIDVERIFAYRMMRFARHDRTELAGFDQDAYVPASRANERPIDSILEEFTAVRQATLTLIKSFTDADLMRTGVGSGFSVTVRGLLFHLAGHAVHHLESIQENYKI